MSQQKEQIKTQITAQIKTATNPVIKAELEHKLKELDKTVRK